MIGRIGSGFNTIHQKVGPKKIIRYANSPIGLSKQSGRSGTLEGLNSRNVVGHKVTTNPKNTHGKS